MLNIPNFDIKTCKKCLNSKILVEFTNTQLKRKSSYCKQCQKNYRVLNKEHLCKVFAIYYVNNKEEKINYQKNYYINNLNKIQEYKKEYYKKNKNDILEYKLNYIFNNKLKTKSRNSIYGIKNRKKIIKKQLIWIKERIKNNPAFKLKCNFSSSINKILKINRSSKHCFKTLDYVPWTLKELKNHIESLFEPWMNWSNQGNYTLKEWDDNDQSTWKWQLDHIIPHSKFKYKTMDCEEFRKCWDLSNLRPYSAKLNVSEGNRR